MVGQTSDLSADSGGVSGQHWPVSVKGVVLHTGRVLLAYNERDEWELPGGRLEQGETLEACVEREILEETGLTVKAGPLVDSRVFEVVPNKSVVIVAYRCDPTDPDQPLVTSHEHAHVVFVPLGELDTIRLPDPYRAVIEMAVSHRTVPSRPVAILMSGAPGSGKSTLARLLSERLRLPLVDKDVLREATLFSSLGEELPQAPWGPGLWYSALESFLGLGLSVIGDMTLFPGVSEADVKSHLAPRAELICVHCRCADPAKRWQEKLDADRLRRNRILELLPVVLELQSTLVEPIELDCPTLIVDTTNGYQPSVAMLEGRLRAIVAGLPR